MLTAEDLDQVRDYVIKILPQLLRADPAIATTIEGMLAELFPRRDEFARLLDEVKALREEQEQNFILVDHDVQQVREEQQELREEQQQGFARVDQEMQQLRGEQQQGFARVDQRFEQVDQRFEQVDQRFQQQDERFSGIDRTLLGMRRDIIQVQAGQETIIRRMEGLEAFVRLVTGQLRSEKGKSLEDMFAIALQYGLKNLYIIPEKIRLRQPLVDVEGLVFKKGFATEIDLIVDNGELIVFEVKTTSKVSDVDWFALKVELVAAQNPSKIVRGVFITSGPPDDIREACARYGMEVVG